MKSRQPYPGPAASANLEEVARSNLNPNAANCLPQRQQDDGRGDYNPAELHCQQARALFEGRYEPSPVNDSHYDVSPDGQRFLMLKPNQQEASAPTQINVVLNWFEELKRRAPQRRMSDSFDRSLSIPPDALERMSALSIRFE